VGNFCKIIELRRIGWRDHMLRMPASSSAKTVWNYKPRGCHAVGRLRKRRQKQI